jgi:heterodisulfide reductase subunit A-like polyferredoxin
MQNPERQNRASHDDGFTPILIIGAGAAGIAVAHQLKHKLGYNNFRMVERQSGIGGEIIYSHPQESWLCLMVIKARGGRIDIQEW